MVKITHDRNVCIGCGACAAVCGNYWEMSEDGKSKLKGAREENNLYTIEVDDEGCNMEAATSCPVNCIHVEKDGKKLI